VGVVVVGVVSMGVVGMGVVGMGVGWSARAVMSGTTGTADVAASTRAAMRDHTIRGVGMSCS